MFGFSGIEDSLSFGDWDLGFDAPRRPRLDPLPVGEEIGRTAVLNLRGLRDLCG